MTELKRCPFCGGKALLLHEGVKGITYECSFVSCSKRDCAARTQSVTISTEYCSDDKAAELWNRREEAWDD